MTIHTINRMMSADMIVHPCKQGVSLLPQEVVIEKDQPTLGQLFNMPDHVFLLDQNSCIRGANQAAVRALGYAAVSDVMGKTVSDISKNVFTQRVLENDKRVLQTESLHIIEENGQLNDDRMIEVISLKFPLYLQEKLMGIFGFSISFKSLSNFAQSLSGIISTGLLGQRKLSMQDTFTGKIFDGVYYNQYECLLLRHIIRGKTAKQIAKSLHKSHRTVEHQIDRLKLKSNTQSRAELIDKAFSWLVAV